jgi:hypothetical protein
MCALSAWSYVNALSKFHRQTANGIANLLNRPTHISFLRTFELYELYEQVSSARRGDLAEYHFARRGFLMARVILSSELGIISPVRQGSAERVASRPTRRKPQELLKPVE